MERKKIRKAVIPAAGLGTRFLPATKAQPKEMLPIVDKPTIQYIVEEAMNSGIEEILVITGRNKRAIEDHFDTNVELELTLQKQHKTALLELVKEISGIEIHYIRQKHMRGLGDAVHCAHTFIGNEPFAVLLGDDVVYNDQRPCLRQLMDCYEEYGGNVLGVQEVPEDKVSSYGIVEGTQVSDKVWRVSNLVEKPDIDKAPSRVAVLGRYILQPEIFDILAHTEPGKGNEIQLTDSIQRLQSPVYAFAYEGRRYDIGDKVGYLQATVEYALRDPNINSQFKAYLKKLMAGEC